VPDRHLLIAHDLVVLSKGPTEDGYRPAINALFRSAALTFGPRAIGVLLSGVLDDGVLGLAAIKAAGGTTVVQHPDDALYRAMPMNALRAGVAEHQVAARDGGALLAKLAARNFDTPDIDADTTAQLENRIAMGGRCATTFESERLGPHSGYICPDCHGSLMSVITDSYRCRVGHAWTAEALLDARDTEVENALLIALRSLHEKAKTSRKLAERAGTGRLFDRYRRLADEAERAVTVLEKRLLEAAGGE
jgi:two-component system, chemotaxis family, protein-glutamate methylesterase/glutaminase